MFEDYYNQPNDSLLQYLLATSGGQGLPTQQPVTAEPVPAEQSLPTEQPVEAVPAEPDWSNMTGWDLSNFNLSNLGSVLSDPGPAYDPNMVYRFDTGNKIGVPKEGGGWDYQNAAPVVFQPGQQYVLTDGSGKNVIARASTPAEMQKLVDLSSSNKDWNLYRADEQGNYTPGTQLFNRSNAGSFGSMILPMLGIAGAGFGLSALGLGAGAAGAGAAGAMPSVGSVLADVGSQLAGTSVFGLPAAATAGSTLAAAAAPAAASGLLGEVAPIVVTGAKTGIDLGTLATVLGAPTAAGLANLANSVSSFQPPVQSTTPPPAVPPTTPVEEIVVEAAKKPPLDIFDIMTLPASTTLAPNTSNITEPSTLQPEAKSSNLLNDILKYYTLGSGVLDMLGVGQGGGSGATTATPYTSTLGTVPTFGRGPFTPFQGDYETYGQGPEWNFFGGK